MSDVTDTPVTTSELILMIPGQSDPLTIVNHRNTLPDVSDATARSAFHKAALASTNLDSDAAYAVSRAMVDPKAAATLLRADAFQSETVEAAELRSLNGHVLLNELFPLIQPRSGAEAGGVSHPGVTGLLDSHGRPTAELDLRFADREHLRHYLRQTISDTRRIGKRYDASILARRVTRPVLAHTARLSFDDGSEPLWVVVVRDGITRVVSAWAARLGPTVGEGQLADEVADRLLETRPLRRAGATATQEHARGREEAVVQDRNAFYAGILDGRPSEQTIRIGQTYSLPTQMYVAIEPAASQPVSSRDIFDDAQRSIVSSIHVDFKGWDTAAGDVEAFGRALHRAQHDGAISDDVLRATSDGAVSRYIGALWREAHLGAPGTAPATELWRAVLLVAILTRRDVAFVVKRELRQILGLSRITNKRYVGYLGPVVDLPWRAAKSRTLRQARRAWATGGPVPDSVFTTNWAPVPVESFRDLLPSALAELEAGRVGSARLTLMVAGGIALAADKLILSNTGSALASKTVPFRVDPHIVVEKLGNTRNGLHQLALTADTYDATRPTHDSLSGIERNAGLTGYVQAGVAVDDPAKISLDAAGAPLPLTVYAVVEMSDPERARLERESAVTVIPTDLSAADAAAQIVDRLESTLGAAADQVAHLTDLQTRMQVGSRPLEDSWGRLFKLVTRVQKALVKLEPETDEGDDEEEDR